MPLNLNEAEEGGIQEEFWKKFNHTYVVLDVGKIESSINVINTAFEGRLIVLLPLR